MLSATEIARVFHLLYDPEQFSNPTRLTREDLLDILTALFEVPHPSNAQVETVEQLYAWISPNMAGRHSDSVHEGAYAARYYLAGTLGISPKQISREDKLDELFPRESRSALWGKFQARFPVRVPELEYTRDRNSLFWMMSAVAMALVLWASVITGKICVELGVPREIVLLAVPGSLANAAATAVVLRTRFKSWETEIPEAYLTVADVERVWSHKMQESGSGAGFQTDVLITLIRQIVADASLRDFRRVQRQTALASLRFLGEDHIEEVGD